jgi:hypothetical protein
LFFSDLGREYMEKPDVFKQKAQDFVKQHALPRA